MSLGRHSIANLIGTIVPILVALVTIPLYLRHIGPERYGVLAVIMALAGYMSFMDLGLGRAVTQRISVLNNASPREHSEILWTALTASSLLGTVGGIGLWLGSDYLLTGVIKISHQGLQEVNASVIWVGIVLPFLLTSNALIGALHAKGRFIEVNTIQALAGSAGLAIPLLVAVAGYEELTYLVPATLAARALTTILLFSQCKKHIPLVGKPGIQMSIIKPLLGYGGWISILSILGPFLVTVDRLVIAAVIGVRNVTSYTIPYDLASRAMVISGSFSSALFPRLAASATGKGKALAVQATSTLVAIMTPTVLAALFLAEPFLSIWIGSAFVASSKGVAEAILLGVWINAVVIPHHARYLATSSPRAVVIIFAFELPIYFILLWLGVSHWGVLGAALAWSTRVLLDTALILKINDVLLITVASVYPSFMLIMAAYLTVYARPNTAVGCTLIAAGLISMSLIKDRHILNDAYTHLTKKL